MKNYPLIFTFAIGCLFLLNSCKKEQKSNLVSKEKDNPSSVMSAYYFNEKASDFTLVVSTTHGISLYEKSPITKSSTSVQAFESNSMKVGELSINTHAIPFSDQTYFLSTDETLNSTEFTGMDLKFQFNSSSTLPSFNSIKYSPAIAELTFQGIDDKKLKRNKDLTINWKQDLNYKKGKALILIYGENPDTKESEILTKEIDDNIQSQTITASELEKFSKFKSVGIYFARGYNETQTISGKSIDYIFINYSWSRIYFSN